MFKDYEIEARRLRLRLTGRKRTMAQGTIWAGITVALIVAAELVRMVVV